jgi:hypothetical protein
MVSVLLVLHNLVRWVVIILSILALVRAYRGWLSSQAWTPRDRQIGVFFTSALDTQVLLGLLLIVFVGFSNLDGFLINHIIPMFVAIVVAHIGSARAQKAADDPAKHRMAALFYSVAVLIILVSIPWGRPLFPGLGGP